MYTKTTALNAQKTIAMFVALVLVALGTGFHMLNRDAHAANVTNFSDTISDSTPSASSNHTFEFTLPNGMAIGDTITITMPAGFTIPGTLDFEDVDIVVVGTGDATVAAAAGAGTWGATAAGQDLVFETPTDGGVASSTSFIIRVGDHATTGVNGAEQITNAAATSTSHEIDIATAWDSGHTRIAMVDNVQVTATVNTTFIFTVSGTSTGSTINGSATTTTHDSTSISLPYGVLSAGTSEMLGQDLTVETNAANGFVVTVEATGPFDSSTGADIDWFDNGTYTTTPSPWGAPDGTLGSENTYGHWALTSDDDDFSGTQDRWISPSTSPQAIFTHNSVSDGLTNDIGRTTVGYQTEITSLQEAGDDYETTLIYIATPTF